MGPISLAFHSAFSALDEANRRRQGRSQQAIDDVMKMVGEQKVDVPENLARKVAKRLGEDTTESWDVAIAKIAAEACYKDHKQGCPTRRRKLRQLTADMGPTPSTDVPLADLPAWIRPLCPRLRMAAPENRPLAGRDVDVGAMSVSERG